MATRSEWDERLKRWAKSGASIEAFAAREGLDARRLKWWRWKLRPSVPSAAAEPRFVPVRVVGGSARAAGGSGALVEVVLTNGRVLRVPPGFDADELARLLAVASQEESC
jgi:transposase